MEGSRVTGRTVTTRTTTTTRSIRTPLKPANVKDLKAMFDQPGDGKTETKTDAKVRTVTSVSHVEPSGLKATSLTSRTNLSKGMSDFGASKDLSSSSSDLLSRYRANRAGYYKENPRETETLGQSVSQSSPDLTKAGNKSPTSTKTSIFSISASDRKTDFGVPKLNLNRVTSTDSVSSTSSKDSSPRSRSECASPLSVGSGSPKLIGRAKPKYLPSPRSDTDKRVEIPISHHSTEDESKLGAGSSISSRSRFCDSSDKGGLSKFGASRFTGSDDKTFVTKTKFGDDGGKTVLSKYTTEVKGPLGTRTRTVEITQTETQSSSSRLLDGPKPWSSDSKCRLEAKDEVKPKYVGSTFSSSLGSSRSSGLSSASSASSISSTSTVSSASSGSQSSWLEKKNARNVLSNFVSKKKEQSNEPKKVEREIPIKLIDDSSDKSTKSMNEITKSWTPFKTDKGSKPEPKVREQTSRINSKVTKSEPETKSHVAKVIKSLPETKSHVSKVTKSEPETKSQIKPQITKRTSSTGSQKQNQATSIRD